MRRYGRILAWIAVVGGGLVLAVSVYLLIQDEPRPTGGERGQAAEELATEIEDAIDLAAWARTGAVRWTFAGRRTLVWDRRRHLVQVMWDGNEVLIHEGAADGVALRNGNEVTGAEARELLHEANQAWINDSFWLNAPAKLRDDGTTLTRLSDDELMVEYSSGGSTPGDAYVWTIGDDGLPTSWRMWVSILPVGGVETTWGGWITLATGAKVATRHVGPLGFTLELTNVEGAATLAELVGGDDPFARLAEPEVEIVPEAEVEGDELPELPELGAVEDDPDALWVVDSIDDRQFVILDRVDAHELRHPAGEELDVTQIDVDPIEREVPTEFRLTGVDGPCEGGEGTPVVITSRSHPTADEEDPRFIRMWWYRYAAVEVQADCAGRFATPASFTGELEWREPDVVQDFIPGQLGPSEGDEPNVVRDPVGLRGRFSGGYRFAEEASCDYRSVLTIVRRGRRSEIEWGGRFSSVYGLLRHGDHVYFAERSVNGWVLHAVSEDEDGEPPPTFAAHPSLTSLDVDQIESEIWYCFDPAEEEPPSEEPAAEEPAAEEPAAEEPAAEEPAVEEPAVDPSVDEPAAAAPPARPRRVRRRRRARAGVDEPSESPAEPAAPQDEPEPAD